MQNIRPISGWALNYVVALDVHARGAAGSYLRASAERRQVVAALLSGRRLPNDQNDAIALADFIGRADHRSILVEAFGDVPDGLRGAMARSGAQPHRRSYYQRLFETLSGGGIVARTIRQLTSIDDERLSIVTKLPEDICSVGLVEIVSGAKMASDIASLVSLLSDNGIDRHSLAQALKRIESPLQLAELWRRWCLKCDFPAHPVPRFDGYRPITNGEELRNLALTYRNCALRYLHEALAGDVAFGEFTQGNIGAVVHLRRHNDMWVVDGIFGKDNGLVPPTIRRAATEYLAEQKSVTVSKHERASTAWHVLHRLTHRFAFEIDW